MRRVLFLSFAVAAGLVACKDAPSADSGACPVAADECPFEVARVLRSLEQLECGLGPDGETLCFWTVTIQESGGWTWSYSDVGETGGWTCDDGPSAFRSGGEDIALSWDADACVMTWEGVEYAPDAL